jgi:hypothetical protein
MMFDQLTATTTVRIVCNAYLYSCLVLMGLSYLGFLVLNQIEKSQEQPHWYS